MTKLLKVAIAILALATGSTAPAHQMYQIQNRLTYYSDPGLTNVTGIYVEYCDGSSAFIGRPDIHSFNESFDC